MLGCRELPRWTEASRRCVWGVFGLVVLGLAADCRAQAPAAFTAQDEKIADNGPPNVKPPKALSEIKIVSGTVPENMKRTWQSHFPSTAIGDTAGWRCDTLYGRHYLLCHDPLYFEDIPQERYGCEMHPALQPVGATVRFFGALPLVPFKWAADQQDCNAWCHDYNGQLRPGKWECHSRPFWCCYPCGY